jgi:hypothetical protein
MNAAIQIANYHIPFVPSPCLSFVGVEIDHDTGDAIETRYYYAYPFELSEWEVLRVRAKKQTTIELSDIPF